ncbi:hypothetical protein S83_008545 [Arachis hypogaea]
MLHRSFHRQPPAVLSALVFCHPQRLGVLSFSTSSCSIAVRQQSCNIQPLRHHQSLFASDAASSNPSVKHVILTSSIDIVTFNGRLLTPKAVVDDTWFFDHELCKESKSWYWYVLSKTLAEDAA